jgi:hypothetical protein
VHDPIGNGSPNPKGSDERNEIRSRTTKSFVSSGKWPIFLTNQAYLKDMKPIKAVVRENTTLTHQIRDGARGAAINSIYLPTKALWASCASLIVTSSLQTHKFRQELISLLGPLAHRVILKAH